MTGTKYIIYFEGQTARYGGDRDAPSSVDDHTVAGRYEHTEDFLQKHGKVVEEKLEVLPWISEGIISASRAHGVYRLHDCLVENKFFPHWGGVSHELWIGGRLMDARKLYKEFKESDGFWYRRWGIQWHEKVFQARKPIAAAEYTTMKSLEDAIAAAARGVTKDGSDCRGK
jgi:hypothetical protein